jgi:hypothetical protein
MSVLGQKRTRAVQLGMCALQTYAVHKLMSAWGQKRTLHESTGSSRNEWRFPHLKICANILPARNPR